MFGCHIATELFILSVSANTIHFGLVPIALGMGHDRKPDYQVHNTLCLIVYAVKIKSISVVDIQRHRLAFCSLWVTLWSDVNILFTTECVHTEIAVKCAYNVK